MRHMWYANLMLPSWSVQLRSTSCHRPAATHPGSGPRGGDLSEPLRSEALSVSDLSFSSARGLPASEPAEAERTAAEAAERTPAEAAERTPQAAGLQGGGASVREAGAPRRAEVAGMGVAEAGGAEATLTLERRQRASENNRRRQFDLV